MTFVHRLYNYFLALVGFFCSTRFVSSTHFECVSIGLFLYFQRSLLYYYGFQLCQPCTTIASTLDTEDRSHVWLQIAALDTVEIMDRCVNCGIAIPYSIPDIYHWYSFIIWHLKDYPMDIINIYLCLNKLLFSSFKEIVT